MKIPENTQAKDAAAAFKEWTRTGKLPASYVQSVLGEELKSVSPNVAPVSPQSPAPAGTVPVPPASSTAPTKPRTP